MDEIDRIEIVNENHMKDGGGVDVEVYINGTRYFLTFFTIENVSHIMKTCATSGECLSGKYMWASDMIVIDELSKDHIIDVVEDLRQSGEIVNFIERDR